MQNPMEADPLLEADPPPPRGGTPHIGHVTCDACWEATPPVNRMTHIALPQTSFVAGHYI